MALTPGLSPNINVTEEPEEMDIAPEGDIVIADADEGEDRHEMNDKGEILRIDHPDGSITINMDGGPIKGMDDDENPPGWFDNLAEKIDDAELSRIADDLIRGIDSDLESRKEWIEDRAQGIRLLGLKIEIPGLQGAADGAPVEGMSKVRHPLLLEAVLRFQANARSELLPTDGPVKVRDDDPRGSDTQADALADALETDMNHYLTSVATEYYPDTDRMLFMLGFGGTSFKKVYQCPLRNRPVSESIDADDLIVNNQATDLQNAKRVTHRIMMRPSVVRRMQIIGAYRDLDLSDPKERETDAVTEAKAAQQGISPTVNLALDRDREIYECYCELDIAGFEHRWKGKESGLEVPYRVTIDASSKQILSVVRNFNETDELPTARKVFVKYSFVPGLGFYDIGLLHILGNTTNAVTAAWRELLDAGMYNNFPGFLFSDTGARQNTNIFRIPPGGGAAVKTGGLPINQAIMPLPYNPPSPALMQLSENIAQYGQRVGGTAEAEVGEGRQNAPVGTTLALIDQAQKILNAVHKRLHAAQSEEFQLLVDCFKENPESFWDRNKSPSTQWNEQTFIQAINDNYLIPQADPNTASHTHRMMKVAALTQLAMQAPEAFNLQTVGREVIKTMGWSNPDEFLRPNTGQPDPQAQALMAKAQSDQMRAQADVMRATADQHRAAADIAKTKAEIEAHNNDEPGNTGHQVDTPVDIVEAQAKMLAQQNKSRELDMKDRHVGFDNNHRNVDRAVQIAQSEADRRLKDKHHQENRLDNVQKLFMGKPI